jgi:hypothetical protein
VPVVRATVAALVLALLAGAAVARAGPNLFVGVTDDAVLWRGGAAVAAANELGLTAIRVTQPWPAGQSELSPSDIARLDPAAAVAAAAGLRVVVTVFGKAVAAPQDDASRDAFCGFVRDLLARYPLVNDVVIWNEPNLGFYWQPQFAPGGASAAPAAYEKLLARCWDVLHAFRPNVNILMTTSPSGNDDPGAANNVSHSPGAFIRRLGAAYKASGRTKPIFDTVGHNPYGTSSAESPWRQHFAPSHIGEADLDRLVQALDDAFDGTPQPVAGACVNAGMSCLSIWYLEAGYQTVPDPPHQSAYVGRENDASAVTDAWSAAGGPTQSVQLTEGIELAYCQPYVTGFFNFLFWDEFELVRWQSGVFWADGSKKASFDALRRVVAAVRTGAIDCRSLRSSHEASAPRSADALIQRIEWPSLTEYSVFNEIWNFAVEARTDLLYRATLRRLDGCGRTAATRCRIVLVGTLRRSRPQVIAFPEQRLVPGTYRIQITVTRKRAPLVRATRQSAPFTVK